MITSYVDQALRRAHYSSLEDGTFCATVPALPGIIATGATVEEWVLVRVARGLRVPPLGRVKVVVKKAS